MGVKKVAVFLTIRPVTQTADVAVKSASTKGKWPAYVLKGRSRSSVPIPIAAAKLAAKN